MSSVCAGMQPSGEVPRSKKNLEEPEVFAPTACRLTPGGRSIWGSSTARAKDMTRQLAVFLFTAFALLLASFAAQAQQFEDIGDYRVHYSAMNTRMLPAEVASAYGITRSGRRAMINITVLRNAGSDDSMAVPVSGSVQASAINLTGQRREIALQEIREEDAVYYIGTFRISNEETLTFDISVRPEDSKRPPARFSFQQKFYVEE